MASSLMPSSEPTYSIITFSLSGLPKRLKTHLQVHLGRIDEAKAILDRISDATGVTLDDEEKSIRLCVVTLITYFGIGWHNFPMMLPAEFQKVMKEFDQLRTKQAR